MKIDINNLPSDLELLKKMVTSLDKEYAILKYKYDNLQNELTLLKRKRYSSSSEKLSTLEKQKLDEQIEELEEKVEESELITVKTDTTPSCTAKVKPDSDASKNDDAGEDGDIEAQEAKTKKKKTENRGKGKKKPLPAHLPREVTILEPEEVCPECNGNNFRKIEDDITEILEYMPGSLKVLKTIRPRCACVDCEKIVQAPPPTRALAKSMAGPGLLAHILANKFCYSLPIYRQSQIFKNEHGIQLQRSTMTGWAGRAAVELRPMIDLIRAEIFNSTHIHGDDTTIKVMAPGLGKTKTGRLWVYVRDGRPHGDTTPPAICYYYSPDRKAKRPIEHLKDYKGIFHADAYAGYNSIYETGEVIEVGCWAHTRRKFYEACVTSKKHGVAYYILERIKEIYHIEANLKGCEPSVKEEQRLKLSKPIIDELIPWMKKALSKISKKSPTAHAINYALNLETQLQRFIYDGRMQIDNNIAEQAMRIIAIGRKNYLFAGSDDGGEFAANIYTLTQTAKVNGISPEKYIKHLLEKMPDYNSQKIHELLPWNVKLE